MECNNLRSDGRRFSQGLVFNQMPRYYSMTATQAFNQKSSEFLKGPKDLSMREKVPFDPLQRNLNHLFGSDPIISDKTFNIPTDPNCLKPKGFSSNKRCSDPSIPKLALSQMSMNKSFPAPTVSRSTKSDECDNLAQSFLKQITNFIGLAPRSNSLPPDIKKSKPTSPEESIGWHGPIGEVEVFKNLLEEKEAVSRSDPASVNILQKNCAERQSCKLAYSQDISSCNKETEADCVPNLETLMSYSGCFSDDSQSNKNNLSTEPSTARDSDKISDRDSSVSNKNTENMDTLNSARNNSVCSQTVGATPMLNFNKTESAEMMSQPKPSRFLQTVRQKAAESKTKEVVPVEEAADSVAVCEDKIASLKLLLASRGKKSTSPKPSVSPRSSVSGIYFNNYINRLPVTVDCAPKIDNKINNCDKRTEKLSKELRVVEKLPIVSISVDVCERVDKLSLINESIIIDSKEVKIVTAEPEKIEPNTIKIIVSPVKNDKLANLQQSKSSVSTIEKNESNASEFPLDKIKSPECAKNSHRNNSQKIEDCAKTQGTINNPLQLSAHNSDINNHNKIDTVRSDTVAQCKTSPEKINQEDNAKIVISTCGDKIVKSNAPLKLKKFKPKPEPVKTEMVETKKEKSLVITNVSIPPVEEKCQKVISSTPEKSKSPSPGKEASKKPRRNRKSKLQKNRKQGSKFNEIDTHAVEEVESSANDRLSPPKQKEPSRDRVCSKHHKNEHCATKHRHKQRQSSKIQICQELDFESDSEPPSPIYFSPDTLELHQGAVPKKNKINKSPKKDNSIQNARLTVQKKNISDSIEKCVSFISSLPSQFAPKLLCNKPKSPQKETPPSSGAGACAGFDEVKGTFRGRGSECGSEESFVIVFDDKVEGARKKKDKDKMPQNVSRARMPSECESEESFVICFEADIGSDASKTACFANDDVFSDSASVTTLDESDVSDSEDDGGSGTDSSGYVEDCNDLRKHKHSGEDVTDGTSTSLVLQELQEVDRLRGCMKRPRSSRSPPKLEVAGILLEKKVRFDSGSPKVHKLIAWAHAYRQARIGPWERCARDAARFRQRITDTSMCLEWVFKREHRARVYCQRFRPLLIKAVKEEKDARQKALKIAKEEEKVKKAIEEAQKEVDDKKLQDDEDMFKQLRRCENELSRQLYRDDSTSDWLADIEEVVEECMKNNFPDNENVSGEMRTNSDTSVNNEIKMEARDMG